MLTISQIEAKVASAEIEMTARCLMVLIRQAEVETQWGRASRLAGRS
jgi:hypothetical protein